MVRIFCPFTSAGVLIWVLTVAKFRQPPVLDTVISRIGPTDSSTAARSWPTNGPSNTHSATRSSRNM